MAMNISPKQTVKFDWLNDALAQQGAYVSGHSSFLDKLDLNNLASSAELRFIRQYNYGNFKFSYFLTVCCEKKNWDAATTVLASNKNFAEIAKNWNSKFGFPLRVVLYDNKNPNLFRYFPDDLSKYSDLDSDGMSKAFSLIDSGITNDAGVQKAINRTSNDSFQDWGRSNLSRYIVINDIDAITLDDANTVKKIFELKRVQEDIQTWEPYVDDATNYQSLIRMSRVSGVEFHTLAYQPEITNKVALHIIDEADKNKIVGKFDICESNNIIPSSEPKPYTSRRRRA
jgi:hypothetical protein